MSEQEQPSAVVPQDIPQETIRDTLNQFTTHANMITVHANLEEAYLHFGLRNSDSPTEANGVAKVYFSLASLKRLAITVTQVVELIEAGQGKEIDGNPNAILTTPESQKAIAGVQEAHTEKYFGRSSE